MAQEQTDVSTKAGRQKDEILLGDLLLMLRKKYSFIISKRKTIFLCALLGGLLGLGYSWYKKAVYTAELSFILEGGSESGLGSYANIAAQFGMNIGSGGSVFQEKDNVIAIIKSRKMIVQTLLSEGDFNGKNELLVDRYLESSGLRKKWGDNPRLANISFQSGLLSLTHDSLLNKFHEQIVKRQVEVEKPDKKLDIIILRYKGKDELFAKLFTETLLRNVTEFYTQVQTKKAAENVTILRRHTDSVRRLLDVAISGVAVSTDANPNPNPAYQRLRVSSQKKMVDVEMNRAILTELIKNLELAEITLRKETPLVQIIDTPVLPLEEHKLGKIMGSFIGILTGLAFCICYIICRRHLILPLMNSQ